MDVANSTAVFDFDVDNSFTITRGSLLGTDCIAIYTRILKVCLLLQWPMCCVRRLEVSGHLSV